jgi:hypothetical protein
MGHETEQIQGKPDLIKLLVDSQNKAALMLAMAEDADGQERRLYHRLADTFGISAELIKELRRQLRQPS